MAAANDAPPPKAKQSRPDRRAFILPARVAALILFVLGLLMLARWVLYRVPRVPFEAAKLVEIVPPTGTRADSGPRGRSAPPLHLIDASPRATADTQAFFTRASYMPGDPADADTTPHARGHDPAQSAGATPAASTEPDRPNIFRRFYRWLSGIFRRKEKERAPVVTSAVASTPVVKRVPTSCPARHRPDPGCVGDSEIVTIAANGEGGEGSKLHFKFSPDTASPIDHRVETSNIVKWDVSGLPPGVHYMNVRAFDDNSGASPKPLSENYRVGVTVGECACVPAPPAAVPDINVLGPDTVSAGVPVTFTTVITGGDPSTTPTFHWTVSAGTITSGQGTPTITVDTTGLGGRAVTATVDVGGFDRSCACSDIVTTNISSLAKTRIVTGRVVGPDGQPVSGATVTADDGSSVTKSVTSDGDGYYGIRLPPGEYTVVVSIPGFSVEQRIVTVSPDGQGEVTLNFSLGGTTTNPTPVGTPTPQPSPGASPTPSATPGASPTPTPDATPEPTPGSKRREQDKITVVRPERFLPGKEDFITCELTRVFEDFVSTQTNVNGSVAMTDRPGPVPGATPGPLVSAFGQSYTAYATYCYESEDLDFTSECAGEKSLHEKNVKWDMKAKLKDGAGDRVSFTLRLLVTWKPNDGSDDGVIRQQAWSRRFEDIPVGYPLDVLISMYGFPVPLTGGFALMGLVGRTGGRKRQEELEAEVAARYREAGTAGGPATRAAEAQTDAVNFSVFTPQEAGPGDSFLVQVFAHLAEQLSQLAALASEADADAVKRGTTALQKPVARGTELTVCLRMDDLKIDEPSQTISWRGEVEAVSFAVSVPERRKPGSVVGVVTVLQESVPVGHLKFVLRVTRGGEQPQAVAPAPVPANFTRYKKAFISYASKDRAEVMKRTQMLDRLKIPYFQDLLDLEPGQRWEPLLYRYIDECDVFYLFWSSAAKRSKWVKKEVQRALRRQGGKHDVPPEIVPVIIEGPPLVPPPRYLAALHFNDKSLYFINPADAPVQSQDDAPTKAPSDH